MIKYSKYILWMIILVIIPISSGECQEDTPLREMDFAYGRRIQLGSDSPLYHFYIDAHVYQHVASEGLTDLRIFNNQKETVPLRIRKTGHSAGLQLKRQKLPIFPLSEDNEPPPSDLILKFKRDNSETTLSLKSGETKEQPSDINGFIIDLKDYETKPHRLLIDLAPFYDDYRLTVKVSASNDLNDWNVLVRSSALVKMTFNGQLLEKKYIDLPSFSQRYLKLTWNKPLEGKHFEHVFGLFPAYPQRRLKQIILEEQQPSPKTDVLTYDAQGFFPTQQIQLRLPNVNTLVKARLSTRKNAKSKWKYHKTALFYRLKVDDTELENSPIKLLVPQDSNFQLELLSDSLPKDGPKPKLILFYNTHECVFVATGEPPFMLAYGNADILYDPPILDDLLEAIGTKKQKTYMGFSRLEPPQVLGGDDRLKRSKKSKEFQLRAVLWIVLILGVAGLMLMAYRLHRQINLKQPD